MILPLLQVVLPGIKLWLSLSVQGAVRHRPGCARVSGDHIRPSLSAWRNVAGPAKCAISN